MWPFNRVPLARLNLMHDRRRFAVCVCGIAFAVFLMVAEWGFLNGLLDASTLLIRSLDADLILTSATRYNMNVSQKFPAERLEQARVTRGVAFAGALYVETRTSQWRNTVDYPGEQQTLFSAEQPSTEQIRAIAFNPEDLVMRMPEVNAQREKLLRPNAILFDRKSKRDYGPVEPGVAREIRGQRVLVVGGFALGTDFVTNGNVIMSDETFGAVFPDPLDPANTLRHVDVGVIRLSPGASARAVCDRLNGELPRDVVVYTREDFIEHEMDFWRRSTPVGFVFQMGMWMGFLVGAGICYQILSADVMDHLREFATLKAIGYRDRYLNWVVLQEGLWLGVISFFPGCLCGQGLYWMVEKFIGLPMYLTWERALAILAMTLLMCVLSGFLALRKVRLADPAEVF
jgi:putative ABC transport system permease protein